MKNLALAALLGASTLNASALNLRIDAASASELEFTVLNVIQGGNDSWSGIFPGGYYTMAAEVANDKSVTIVVAWHTPAGSRYDTFVQLPWRIFGAQIDFEGDAAWMALEPRTRTNLNWHYLYSNP